MPGRLAVLPVGAGHAGDGQAHVGAQHPPGAHGHGLGRGRAHDRALGHAEQRRTSPRWRSDTIAAAEHVAGARHVGEAGAR